MCRRRRLARTSRPGSAALSLEGDLLGVRQYGRCGWHVLLQRVIDQMALDDPQQRDEERRAAGRDTGPAAARQVRKPNLPTRGRASRAKSAYLRLSVSVCVPARMTIVSSSANA